MLDNVPVGNNLIGALSMWIPFGLPQPFTRCAFQSFYRATTYVMMKPLPQPWSFHTSGRKHETDQISPINRTVYDFDR